MVASSTSLSMTTSKQSSTTLSYEKNSPSKANIACSNDNVLLPKEKYTLVGIAIDTTGRRLIDEIVQLAAFTPNDNFKQYIMPYMNLNPAARQRHQVRVDSIGFYRMLRSTLTYKIIKSKSEIAALKDFLDWLEALKAKDKNSNGIILLHHEERKFIPYMILEAFKKYNLLERFLNIVKSFANVLNLTKSNLNESLQRYSLRRILTHLKNNSINCNILASSSTPKVEVNGDRSMIEQKQKSDSKQKDAFFDGNASFRAKLAYEVALLLSNQGPKESLSSENAIDNLLFAVQTYAKPVESDLNELEAQNKILERQNSFRPVFLNYFKAALYHRVRAVRFRICLAEQGYDLQTLNSVWSERQKDGISEVLQTIKGLKAKEKTELADLFDSYFDPTKTTIEPNVKKNRRRNKRALNSSSNEAGAEGDKQQGDVGSINLPDSTTKSPKNQRGKRNTRSNNKNMPRNQATLPKNQPVSEVANQPNNANTVSEAEAAKP